MSSDSIVNYTHSLAQTDSIVAYASLGKEAVSYKNSVHVIDIIIYDLSEAISWAVGLPAGKDFSTQSKYGHIGSYRSYA